MANHINIPDIDFSNQLYSIMQEINPGIVLMEPYEFVYSLNNVTPSTGWHTVTPESTRAIEKMIIDRKFYDSIKIKEEIRGKIQLDTNILQLTQQLFVGLVIGDYSTKWANEHFYFDIRSFIFFHKTPYFEQNIIGYLGGKPYQTFDKKQAGFETFQEIGYQVFKEANHEVDNAFIAMVHHYVNKHKKTLLIAIAGPTAAGKTEIVERLSVSFTDNHIKITSIELDNFLTDRDYREEKGIFTQGKEALHFDLLIRCLNDISVGKKIQIPRYDFVDATSSHDLQGNLKPDGKPIEIEPANIIFIEGNFPFLLREISSVIDLKIVYLTDDHVRLKRKWRRDIDYRKKYEPTYFRNRFFKDQFIMAEIAYRPQMLLCDIVVDTTGAALWITPELQTALE